MSASHQRRRRRLLSQTNLAMPQIEPKPLRVRGHELLRASIRGLGAAIREDYSIALASTMLRKPRDKVTTAEAVEALHSSLMITNPVQQNKVIRAGMRSFYARVAPDLLPMAHAALMVSALTRLDDGDEAAGVLTPAPTDRRGGSEARNRERVLATEVAFQMGRHKTSRDKALQVATGIGRGDWNWTQPPTLPWSANLRALQRVVDAGWEDNPGMKDEAMAEGERLYDGKNPSPEFLAYRRDYLRFWGTGRRRWRVVTLTGKIKSQTSGKNLHSFAVGQFFMEPRRHAIRYLSRRPTRHPRRRDGGAGAQRRRSSRPADGRAAQS